jgi:hypothetical protein
VRIEVDDIDSSWGTRNAAFAAFADKTYFRYYGAIPEAPKLSGE